MIMIRVSQSSDLEVSLDTWVSTVLITASLSMEILQTLKSQEESRTSLLPTDRHCLKSVLAVQLTLHHSSISSISMLSLKEDRIHTIFCCYWLMVQSMICHKLKNLSSNCPTKHAQSSLLVLVMPTLMQWKSLMEMVAYSELILEGLVCVILCSL